MLIGRLTVEVFCCRACCGPSPTTELSLQSRAVGERVLTEAMAMAGVGSGEVRRTIYESNL